MTCLQICIFNQITTQGWWCSLASHLEVQVTVFYSFGTLWCRIISFQHPTFSLLLNILSTWEATWFRALWLLPLSHLQLTIYVFVSLCYTRLPNKKPTSFQSLHSKRLFLLPVKCQLWESSGFVPLYRHSGSKGEEATPIWNVPLL